MKNASRVRCWGAGLALLTFLVPEGVPAGPTPAPSRPARPSASIRWVAPPAAVSLDCPKRVLKRQEWIAFGQDLDDLGIEIRLDDQRSSPREVLLTVRCEVPGAAVTPGPTERVVPLDDSGTALRKVLQEVRDALAGESLPRPARVLMLAWDDGEVSATLLREASWMVTYSRLEADFLDLRRVGRLPWPWLSRYDAVMVLTDHLPPATAEGLATSLGRYLQSGGGLVLPGGIDDEAFRVLAGAEPARGTVRLTGWSCTPTFLPGAEALTFRIPEADAEDLPAFRPPPGSKVLCGIPGTEVPLAFRGSRGKGTVVAWTAPMTADKSARGLMLLSLMEATPLAAALMDMHVFFVDDCPLPTSGRPVRVEAGAPEVPDAVFYPGRWWTDVLRVFESFAVRPTFAFILTYDDRKPDQGPPPTYQDPSPSLDLARAIAAAGYEVDLHGFNHQSLSVGRNEWTVGWSGPGEMRQALQLLRDEYRRIFGEDRAPRAYIAPSNFVQRAGKEALRQVFPEVTVLSTQYLDEGPILGQEFGSDPEVPSLWNLPRISSEHFLDGDNAMEVLNALVLPGVFSHFIHPDDLLDPERSRDRDWPEMVRELERLLSTVDRAHPWLTRRTAAEAAHHLDGWWQSRFQVLRDSNGLLVRVDQPPEGGLTFLVRPPRGRDVRIQGSCEVVFQSRVESRWVLRSPGGACGIFWQ